MKIRFTIVFFVFLLIVSFMVQTTFVVKASQTGYSKDLYFGVDIAYYNNTEFKAEVDEISSYTNLIVIGADGISSNLTLLNEACQYLYDKGLSFIIYEGTVPV